MRGLLPVSFVIVCSTVMMAGAGGSEESDAVKSAVDASAQSLSMSSNSGEKAPAERAVVEKLIPDAANPDAVQRDPTAAKEATPAEQASSPPAAEAAEAKRGDDSAAARGSQAANAPANETSGLTDSICLILESAAAAHGLPLEFFTRVIWQESRFKPDAIGPPTRTGHRAQGIAQFMPYTAMERGLLNPFDPDAALLEAAEFLAELRREFGNLGLAAAAYNAGPGRLHDFIDGRGSLPAQTRHYVRAITGRSVEQWSALGRETAKDGIIRPTSCRSLTTLLKEPRGIPDSHSASVGQNTTKRSAAGPLGTNAPRNKQVRMASFPTGAARPNSGHSPASPESKRSSNAPPRSRIISPTSIARDNSTQGMHSRGSGAAQNSKSVQVHTASLSNGGTARQPKAPVGSRGRSEGPTKSGRSAAILPTTAASRLRPSNNQSAARLQTVPPKEIAREKSARFAALPAKGGARTTEAQAAEQRRIDTSAMRAKSEKPTRVTSAVLTRSGAKLPSDRIRAVARDEDVKASEDRLRKVMQICRGC